MPGQQAPGPAPCPARLPLTTPIIPLIPLDANMEPLETLMLSPQSIRADGPHAPHVGAQQQNALVDAAERVFVGGLPYYLSEEQCRELLGSFGGIKSFDLVKDRDTGNSKG